MPKTMVSNIFCRSCLDQLFKNRLEGSDYQYFDNKVESPFNKMGGVRLNLQKIRQFLYSCESSHIIKSFLYYAKNCGV